MMTLKYTKNCLKTLKREIKPFIGDYAESNKAMFGKNRMKRALVISIMYYVHCLLHHIDFS